MATKNKNKRYYKTTSGNYRARVSRDGKRIGRTFTTASAAKAWIAEMTTKSNS